MKKVSKNTILRRTPDLDIKIRSNTEIEIILNEIRIPGNQYSLVLLNTFSSPKSLDQGISETGKMIRGAQEWVDLASHATYLFETGILQEVDDRSSPGVPFKSGYSSPNVHIRMLNDYSRTKSFQQAIFDTVTKDDIVVEVGMGTGILSATAAIAGAKHVYAIERTHNWPELARRIFDLNGISDRITIIEGDSSNVEIPEKADIFISEMVGNDPLDENILPITADAVKRFMKQSFKLIPYKMRILGLPVSVPVSIFDKYFFTDGLLRKWQNLYGLDFSSLLEFSKEQNQSSTTINTFKAREWKFLTDPVVLYDINLADHQADTIKSSCVAPVKRSGILNGIIVYFELGLSEKIEFSIHPDQATPENHWASKVWLSGTPLVLKKGDKLVLDYEFHKEYGSQFKVKYYWRSSSI